MVPSLTLFSAEIRKSVKEKLQVGSVEKNRQQNSPFSFQSSFGGMNGTFSWVGDLEIGMTSDIFNQLTRFLYFRDRNSMLAVSETEKFRVDSFRSLRKIQNIFDR